MNEKTIARFIPKFKLRTLQIFLTLCCILAAWGNWFIKRSHKQRDTVKAILQAGGGVVYSYRYRSGTFDAKAVPGPKWLLERVGVDLLDHVVVADFY